MEAAVAAAEVLEADPGVDSVGEDPAVSEEDITGHRWVDPDLPWAADFTGHPCGAVCIPGAVTMAAEPDADASAAL